MEPTTAHQSHLRQKNPDPTTALAAVAAAATHSPGVSVASAAASSISSSKFSSPSSSSSALALSSSFSGSSSAPKFHVNDAVLTQFTLSPDNNTLYYNLSVNMTLRNPNRRVGSYYDRIEANAEYHDQRFATQNLDTFYLGHKKVKDLSTVFRGERVLGNLDGGDRSDYNSERTGGVYNIDLKLKLRMRLKVWWAKPKFKPQFECDLKIPMNSGGGVSSRGFQRIK